jgi:adenosylmethionine-8-amino-7-oxononanoate aminotransferase
MESTHLIKPHLRRSYPMVQYGKGVYVYDTTGKKYLDGCSGAVTANIGHGVEEIVKIMKEQATKVSFVYRSQFTSEPAERLAKKLSDLAPGEVYWTFLVNSGSEATETAMKIAIQYWQEKGKRGKNKVLSRWLSYHGITLGALSMSGHPMRRMRFVPLLEDFPSISPPYCYRCPYHATYPSCNLRCANELEEAINRIGSEHIAAFIAEPIVGAAGAALTPPKGYYEKIREICDHYEILLIIDEVMTGLGRTGTMFAIEHWNVEPDLIALGKGLGAGYTPIAATLVSERIIEPILHGSGVIMSGHTLSANPLSSAIALAVLKYIDEHQLADQAEMKGQYLFNQLLILKKQFSWIGDVRGKGLLIGIEFVHPKTKSMLPSKLSFTEKVVMKAQQNGLLVYPSAAGNGKDGAAIIIAPPLTIKKEEIDELITLLTKTFLQLEPEISILRSGNGSDQNDNE